MTTNPHMVMFAGANGSGKSTAASRLLPHYVGIQDFVNADTIARGLSAHNPDGMALAAGRLMLERLDELVQQRISFAFETTLSGRTYATWIAHQRALGYRFHLLYFWLSDADTAVNRVRDRVKLGGHNIPTDTIRRRYVLSVQNFFRLYRPLADFWQTFDNSDPSGAVPIAMGTPIHTTVFAEPMWSRMQRGA
jgi:predicted ABC-type ATPase